jgi:hypothetical protein
VKARCEKMKEQVVLVSLLTRTLLQPSTQHASSSVFLSSHFKAGSGARAVEAGELSTLRGDMHAASLQNCMSELHPGTLVRDWRGNRSLHGATVSIAAVPIRRGAVPSARSKARTRSDDGKVECWDLDVGEAPITQKMSPDSAHSGPTTVSSR